MEILDHHISWPLDTLILGTTFALPPLASYSWTIIIYFLSPLNYSLLSLSYVLCYFCCRSSSLIRISSAPPATTTDWWWSEKAWRQLSGVPLSYWHSCSPFHPSIIKISSSYMWDYLNFYMHLYIHYVKYLHRYHFFLYFLFYRFIRLLLFTVFLRWY